MVAAPRHSFVSLNSLLGRAGTFLQADVSKNVYQLGAFINKLLFSRDNIPQARQLGPETHQTR